MSLDEFAKWVAEIRGACPDPADVALYHRAVICKTFPAYTLRGLKDEPAGEIFRALELLHTAHEIQNPAPE